MMRQIKFTSLLLAVLCLILGLGVVQPATADEIPRPQPPGNPYDCYEAAIYYGVVPPDGQDSPVLVFVHGYAALAKDWWERPSGNDIYEWAYEAGYRTAFVSLNVETGFLGCKEVERRPVKDMFANGATLTKQLEFILDHYDVDAVDIIAHSKGGVDTHAAIVWSGAQDMVRHVFTLSSPHQGSLLVDILWSEAGNWLEPILGRDGGTYYLQTGLMQAFRESTDASEVDDHIEFYAAAGTGWQGSGGMTEQTGALLQGWDHPLGGDNDGIISVASAHLPGATTLFIEPWNHSTITAGWNAFPYVQPILYDAYLERLYFPLVVRSPAGLDGQQARSFDAQQPSESLTDGDSASASQALASNFVLRGGRVGSSAAESIPIEPRARAVKFGLLATDSQTKAALVGPDGLMYPLRAAPNDSQGFFGEAFFFERTVNKPSPGAWTLEVDAPPGTGYMLLVVIDSDLRVTLDGLPARTIQSREPIRLTAQSEALADSARVERVEMRVTSPRPGSLQALPADVTVGMGTRLDHTFTQDGVYSMMVTVSGETIDGMPFERTFVRSQAVLSADEHADGLANFALSRR